MKFLVDSGLLPKCCSRDASDSARPLGVEDYESGSYPWYSIGMRNLFLFGLVMRVITIIIFVRSVSSRSRASRSWRAISVCVLPHRIHVVFQAPDRLSEDASEGAQKRDNG